MWEKCERERNISTVQSDIYDQVRWTKKIKSTIPISL